MDRFVSRCKVSGWMLKKQLKRTFSRYGSNPQAKRTAQEAALELRASPVSVPISQVKKDNMAALIWMYMLMSNRRWNPSTVGTHPRPA